MKKTAEHQKNKDAKKRSCIPARRRSGKPFDPKNPFGLKPKPLPVVALHEAGHLLAALVLGVPLEEKAAVLEPSEGLRGCVYFRDWEAAVSGKIGDRVQLENYAVCYLAGRAADEIRAGYSLESFTLTGAEGDLASVDLILGLLVPPNLPEWAQDGCALKKNYWWVLMSRARALLAGYWPAVQALSKALLARKVLSLHEAQRIALRACPHAPEQRRIAG